MEAVQANLQFFVLELRSFGIRVITVAPGAIKSKLANSSLAKYNKMAGWKYYQKFEVALRARAELTQGPKSAPTDVFAKNMITAVLKKNPPSFFSYGHHSVLTRLGYYLPLCIRDFLYRVIMKC